MQLKYEHLPYQKHAIDSIVNIFNGYSAYQQSKPTKRVNNTLVQPNQLNLAKEQILKNLQTIQQNNHLSLSSEIDELYFTVEMETGTGKTFVYLNTIIRLYQEYDWDKFIIVVPSVAIREGVLHSIRSMNDYFNDNYGIDINPIEYSGKKSMILKIILHNLKMKC